MRSFSQATTQSSRALVAKATGGKAAATMRYALALAVATLGAPALAQSNPVDPLSNPDAVSFPDVTVSLRQLDAPFVRDGTMIAPETFARVMPGLTKPQVRSILGDPVTSQSDGWDYNFKFVMPQSGNYRVCQYKVLFDGSDQVDTSVWRRRQCEALVAGR